MNKYFLIISAFFLPLTILCTLSACTSQKLFKNETYLRNSCGQILQVVIANDSNIDLPERELAINPGTQELIGFYNAYGEDVIGQIQDSYELRIIDSDGAFLQIDARTLRSHLQQVKNSGTGSTRQWVIDDLSFRPQHSLNIRY